MFVGEDKRDWKTQPIIKISVEILKVCVSCQYFQLPYDKSSLPDTLNVRRVQSIKSLDVQLCSDKTFN